MQSYDVYKDVAERTDGDIYVGVVGPVRTGKSTFVTNFMEKLVLPNITGKTKRSIAIDEMPQSADGKTVMTTEPKFVPAEAVSVDIGDNGTAKVRLIDCVGYMVEGALGGEEDGVSRKVKTPWHKEEIPFEKAAEYGTHKVICEHSTIGVVVTTDGSIAGIERENYLLAEERVINGLKQFKKPFIVVVNTKDEDSLEAKLTKQEIEEKYGVTTVVLNVLQADEKKLKGVIESILLEFPLRKIDVDVPDWMRALPADNAVITELLSGIKKASIGVEKMKHCQKFEEALSDAYRLTPPTSAELSLGEGIAKYKVGVEDGLFYEILSAESGEEISDEFALMNFVKRLSVAKKYYEKFKDAIEKSKTDGYGIVEPTIEELSLDDPKIVKQGGHYSVKIKAHGESYHLLKVDVTTDVCPMVGTEKQCEDFIDYLHSQSQDGDNALAKTNMFGKPLGGIACQDICVKTQSMPTPIRYKIRRVATKSVNEGKGNLICLLI